MNTLKKELPSEITLSECKLLARSLGLTHGYIHNTKHSFRNLNKVVSAAPKGSFDKLESVLDKVNIRNQAEEFHNAFPVNSANANNSFNIQDNIYEKNKIYGIFSGLTHDSVNSFSSDFALIPKNHTVFVFLSLVCLIKINLDQKHDEPYRGLKSFSDNLKKLTTQDSWKEDFSSIVQKACSNTDVSISSFNELINYLKFQKAAIYPYLEADPQIFLKKLFELLEVTRILDNFSKKPATKNSVSDNKNTAKKVETSDDLENSKLEQMTLSGFEPLPSLSSVQIWDKLTTESWKQNEIDELERNSLEFIRMHRHPKDAHPIAQSNAVLLPNEINSLEIEIQRAIHEEMNENDRLQRLCWSLMLYYGVPVNRIPTLQFGFEKATTAINTIYLDLENHIISIPTPFKKIKPDSHHNQHLIALPLYSTIESILKIIIQDKSKVENTNSLRQFISPELLENSKSFKDISNFRQYRITAGKVSRTIGFNTYFNTLDEVKTAYLNGGEFNFLHSGTHYTELNKPDLVNTFKQVAKKTFQFWQFQNFDLKNDQIKIGSESNPNIETVRHFLNEKHLSLLNLKKQLKTAEDYWHFHNEFTLYSITILNLSALHRPQNDIYYSASIFLPNDTVQITDKVENEAMNGRIAILSSIAIEQYRYYLKYLENLIFVWIDQGQYELAKMFKNATSHLNSNENGVSLFSLIDKGKIRSIKTKDLEIYYKSISGLELNNNFYRHLFSSWATEMNTPRFIIAAQMGHASRGLETYSPNLFFSPSLLREKIQNLLNELMVKLEVKTFKNLHIANIKKFPNSTLEYQLEKLGPYQRAFIQKKPINTEDRAQIDRLLFPNSKIPNAVYVTKKEQEKHKKKLERTIKSPHKTLELYYQFQKETRNWKIASNNSLYSSPFSKTYGYRFHKNNNLVETIQQLTHNLATSCNPTNHIRIKVILMLSAAEVGAVLNPRQLLSIANIQTYCYLNVGFSYAVNIEHDGNKNTWILNGISVAILNLLKRLEEKSTKDFSQESLDQFLNSELKLPSLEVIARACKNVHQMTIPSYLLNYHSKTHIQSSIGVEGYRQLSLNYRIPETSRELFQVPLLRESSDKSKSDKFLKDLSKKLNEVKSKNRKDRKNVLNELIEWKSTKSTENKIHFFAEILFEWICFELSKRNGTLQPSSVADYFSRLYNNGIVDQFIGLQSIDDVNDSLLKDEIYPSFFAKLEDKNSLLTAELSSLHDFLTLFGFAPLHFENKKITSFSITENILTESEFKHSLDAIDADSNTLKETKICLKLTLIFYRRLGLRRYEALKLNTKDIDLVSQTVHIAKYEKTKAGNRLLPYHLLLEETEIKLLENWVNKLRNTFEEKTEQLLFSFISYPDEEQQKLKIYRYLTSLVRQITGKNDLSIKSLRKSFASEIALQILLQHNQALVLKTLDLRKNFITPKHLKNFMGNSNPENCMWLLANWMGHASPQTTLESYILTMDLIVFLKTEEIFEERQRHKKKESYTEILKACCQRQDLSESVFKNLNRVKGFKYPKLFIDQLSETKTNIKDSILINYETLFEHNICINNIQKTLTLHTVQYSIDKIKSKLIIPDEYLKHLISTYKKIISKITPESDLNSLIEQSIIDRCTYFYFKDGEIHQNKTHKRGYEFISECLRLDTQDINTLFELWLAQIDLDFMKDGAFIIKNTTDLKTTLKIFQKLPLFYKNKNETIMHVVAKGFITNSRLLDIQFDSNIYFSDKRVQTNEKLALTTFHLKLSVRQHNSKKTSSCPIAINAGIFLSKITLDAFMGNKLLINNKPIQNR